MITKCPMCGAESERVGSVTEVMAEYHCTGPDCGVDFWTIECED